jgi:predicted CXXCH cytochrome family protein
MTQLDARSAVFRSACVGTLFLIAWLLLTAMPVLADGGPHVASVNSGVSSLTADSCAGCHRAHTAQGALLLKTAEEELCLSCHGDAVVGATTDVMSGIQYALGTNGLRNGAAVLGALRGGGYDQARIGNPFRIAIANTANNPPTPSRKAKVEVAAAGANVTSAHLAMAENGLTAKNVAWGNGANGSGAGPTVSLGCASCHNPHGNGAYRILNPVPSLTAGSAGWTAKLFDVDFWAMVGTTPTFFDNVYRTEAAHGLLVGDHVTVTGNGEPTANVVDAVVATVPASNRFTLVGVSPAAYGALGTVTRLNGVMVKDAPAAPANDTRNYTVIQNANNAGTMLASQIVTAGFTNTQGDYFARQVPWMQLSGAAQDGPNGYQTNAGSVAAGTYVPAFNDQITMWCASCHTRYFGYQQPTTSPANGTVGAAYANPRPGDSVFTYQHSTRSNRSCNTCHVAHGSNAVMDGAYSSTFTYPDGAASASSRLLKVGNRGTCQLCHDPTGVSVIGDQYPAAPYLPTTP